MEHRAILSDRRFSWGGVLLALGGAFWTVVQIREQTLAELPGIPASAFRYALFLGYCLVLIGLTLMSVASISHYSVLRLFRRGVNEANDFVILPLIDCGPTRRAELQALHDFGEQDFGRVSELRFMEKLYDWNPLSFYSVRSRRDSAQIKLVGYFIIYPLTAKASRAVEECRLNGLNLGPEDLVRKFRNAQAIYVGAVLGTTCRAQAVALQALRSELRKYGTKLPFYARPVSRRGRTLLSEYRFTKLKNSPDGVELWKREPMKEDSM